MKTEEGKKSDGLSDLGAWLRELECEHVDNEDGTAIAARNELVDMTKHYHHSRYRFGNALANYKAFYAEDGGWVAAAEVIGRAIGRDKRTIFRILEDYERTCNVPSKAIQAMEVLGKDPAAKKNAPIIDTLRTMEPADIELAPEASVETAIHVVAAQKAAKKTKAARPRKPVHACGTTVIVLPTIEEKQRRDIRSAIRAALANLPVEEKLAVLQVAVEEAMYEDLDQREPITIIFTPRPSSQTTWVQQEQERAA